MLQVSRCSAVVLAMVRAAYEGRTARVQDLSIEIATDILRFARDRSRDKYLRPLLDLQRRTDPLTKPRRRMRKKAA